MMESTDSPLAPEAGRRMGAVLAGSGNKEAARQVYQRLRDEFGWIAGVREEAEAALEAL